MPCPDCNVALPGVMPRPLPDGSIDLVITSPPFLDIVHYAADNWLRCWFAGIDPDDVEIAMHRSEEAWTAMVHDVLREQARIVIPYQIWMLQRIEAVLAKALTTASGRTSIGSFFAQFPRGSEFLDRAVGAGWRGTAAAARGEPRGDRDDSRAERACSRRGQSADDVPEATQAEERR